MTKVEMIEFVRAVEACPPHQTKPIPCPDQKPGCCVLHLGQFKALDSAKCCEECTWMLAKAILQTTEKGSA